MVTQEGRTLRERLTGIEFLVTLAILVPLSFIIFDVVSKSQEIREQSTCQSNLKRIGRALQMYANESKGERYPPAKLRDCEGAVQPWSGAMDIAGVYPEYLAELDLLVCPAYGPGKTAVEIWDEGKTTNPRWAAVDGFSNNGVVEPCEVLAKPYYYYGWVFSVKTFQSAIRYQYPKDRVGVSTKSAKSDFRVTTVKVEFDPEVHFGLFREAVAALSVHLKSGIESTDMDSWRMKRVNGEPVALPRGTDIPRIRMGIERFFSDDISSPATDTSFRGKIIVLHEELFRDENQFYHRDGLNVLYMDGHVESLSRRKGEGAPFPLNEAGYILHDAVEGTLEAP
jgi:prepilin-type processing-associated H-X9-DG protein